MWQYMIRYPCKKILQIKSNKMKKMKNVEKTMFSLDKKSEERKM